MHFNLHCITIWWKTTSRTWQMNGDCTWPDRIKWKIVPRCRNSSKFHLKYVETLTRTFTWFVTFLAWYRPKKNRLSEMMRWYKCFARENECKTPTVAHNQHCCKEHWVLILKFIHNQHCCKEHGVLILKFIHNIFNLHDIEVVMCILLVNTHDNIKCERWNILILKTHLFIHFEMTLSCNIGLYFFHIVRFISLFLSWCLETSPVFHWLGKNSSLDW